MTKDTYESIFHFLSFKNECFKDISLGNVFIIYPEDNINDNYMFLMKINLTYVIDTKDNYKLMPRNAVCIEGEYKGKLFYIEDDDDIYTVISKGV